jgi:hypothetical protein
MLLSVDSFVEVVQRLEVEIKRESQFRGH